MSRNISKDFRRFNIIRGPVDLNFGPEMGQNRPKIAGFHTKCAALGYWLGFECIVIGYKGDAYISINVSKDFIHFLPFMDL